MLDAGIAARLVVFWNAGQPPPAITQAFAEVFRRVLPGSPGHPAAVAVTVAL